MVAVQIVKWPVLIFFFKGVCKSGNDMPAFFFKMLLLIRMMSVMELQKMLREK